MFAKFLSLVTAALAAEPAVTVPTNLYDCTFDITIDDESHKLNFNLFAETPITSKNFADLANGYKFPEGVDGFKDSIFHRIIPAFMAQGGDFTHHNGRGGRCTTETNASGKFRDENFTFKCNEAGLLAMANAGPHTNGSQFFFTFRPTDWLSGRHVVFGKVKGDADHETLRQLELVGSRDGSTTKKVVVAESSCKLL